MKKKILLPLLFASLLASCDQGQCQHVDEDKNHICDLCNTPLSEHKDENKDHYCDYCGDQLNGCIDEDLDGKCDICGKDMDLPYEYAEWPTKEIQDEVIVVSGSEVKIPEYNRADDIEINTDDEIESGYFSIYCYTENKKSEDEYKQILIDAGWEVEEEKDEQGYISAYDSNYEVWMNFGYFEDYSDLEICITCCYKTKWPGDYIAESLQIIAPGTKTVIPEFEAYTTIATYYPEYNILAINGYGFTETIEEDYKGILTNASWSISFNETSDEWNAVSPYNDIEIHFYYDDEKGDFNVDVLKYVPSVEGWPYEEIAAVVEEMGATGEVPAFTGENDGFLVETDWFPPAIFIYTDKSKQAQAASDYNNYIQDLGYVYVGDMYGDPMYAQPGTTLAIRALVMMDVLEIEMFKLDEPAK